MDQKQRDAINAAQASWQKDGTGLRGTPMVTSSGPLLNFPPASIQIAKNTGGDEGSDLGTPNMQHVFGGGGDSSGNSHTVPFQVQRIPTTNKAGIYFYSPLWKLDFTSVSITGLLDQYPVGPTAGGGTTFSIGDKIWMEIATTAPTAPTAQIKTGAVGGAEWDEYPYPISIDSTDPANPFQDFYNLLLVEVVDGDPTSGGYDTRPGMFTIKSGGTTKKFVQMFSRGVQLSQRDVLGVVCLVPDNPALDYKPTPL